MGEPFQYDIFISYSHRDAKAAEELQAKLEKHGLKVWRDPRLDEAAGKPFPDSIEKALRASRRAVVLWSTNSVKSVWVKAEAELARTLPPPDDRGATGKLVPILLEKCDLPIPHNIVQAIAIEQIDRDLSILLRALSVSGVKIVSAHIDISKVPPTYAKKLYGRECEMAALFEAWDEGRTHPSPSSGTTRATTSNKSARRKAQRKS